MEKLTRTWQEEVNISKKLEHHRMTILEIFCELKPMWDGHRGNIN